VRCKQQCWKCDSTTTQDSSQDLVERVKSQVPAHLCKPRKMGLCARFTQGKREEALLAGIARSHINPNKQITSRKKQGQLHGRLSGLGRDDHKSSPQVRQLRQKGRAQCREECRTQRESSVLHHYSHFLSCTSYVEFFLLQIDRNNNFCGILTNILLPEKGLADPKPNKSWGSNKRYYLSLKILSQL